ncbi:MAG: HK97 gp10 family phage protein [Candidatus Bathyarchaeota archaeon]|nr:HK97 gp10 family phage protein [Candidatus Bathyarchaeota archaeon]
MISVEVTETGVSLSKVASDMPVLAKAILEKAVGYAKGRAEELTPVRSGLMRQSWYVTEQDDMNIALSNRAPYFLYFIEGTSPHEIRPRFASALRFQVGDEVVFARLVNHPGTKPSDLLEQVKKGTAQETPRFFAQAWDEVTDYEEY